MSATNDNKGRLRIREETDYDRSKLEWLVPMMAEIKNLGRQLLERGCNPVFTCPEEGESRPYVKKRLSKTDRERLAKEKARKQEQ